MMRRLLLLSIGLLALQSPLFAAPVGEEDVVYLTLDDAVRYALQHNISIKNAKVDVALQRAKNSEITGIALPQINGKDEFNYYPAPIQSFVPAEFIGGAPGTFVAVPFTPKFTNTASLSASQIAFDGSILVALQARNTLIELSQLGVRATETDVRYNVRKAYYSMIVAQKQFDILKNTIASFRQISEEQLAMYKEGFVEKIDVDRSAVQLSNLQTDSLKIANMLDVSAQYLKYSMGMPLSRVVKLRDTEVIEEIERIGQDLETTLNYSLRTEYQQLLMNLKLNEYDLKRYKYKALPTLSVFGNLATTYSSNRFRDVASFSNYINYALVGAQLNVPIFSGFQRKYQVKQAQLNIDKTKNNLEMLRQSIDFQSSQFRITLRNALLSVKAQETNLNLANSVLDLSRKKYKAGVGSTIEISQAQTELLRAQSNYFGSLLDVVNARNDLSKSTGALSVSSASESTLQPGNNASPDNMQDNTPPPSNPSANPVTNPAGTPPAAPDKTDK